MRQTKQTASALAFARQRERQDRHAAIMHEHDLRRQAERLRRDQEAEEERLFFAELAKNSQD